MGRAFLENKNDPKPAVESIRKFTKIYPYEAGGVGTSIAEFLSGKAKLARLSDPLPTIFHEGSGKVMNTVPPNDFSFYQMLDEIVQQEPATSLDPEQMGPLAAIGIVKGKPFPPTGHRQLDARTAFFYYVTGITPTMAMRVPGIGS